MIESEVPTHLPARMLNEYVYCARLFYLEWVQREWAASEDTVEGAWRHRRVDEVTARRSPQAPKARGGRGAARGDGERGPVVKVEPWEGELSLTSVELSSDEEGLIARMDLVRKVGRAVVPVEVKRGEAPTNARRSWDPERVQLCAQGLILRARVRGDAR